MESSFSDCLQSAISPTVTTIPGCISYYLLLLFAIYLLLLLLLLPLPHLPCYYKTIHHHLPHQRASFSIFYGSSKSPGTPPFQTIPKRQSSNHLLLNCDFVLVVGFRQPSHPICPSPRRLILNPPFFPFHATFPSISSSVAFVNPRPHRCRIFRLIVIIQ
jgi:hypothetical protein